jgi:hypothetical protein
LTRIGPDLWEHVSRVRVFGFVMPHRMTVMRERGGELVVHSPTYPHAELCAALEELGDVAAVVAPSRAHDLFLSEWLTRYPRALLYVPDLRMALRLAAARVRLLSEDVTAAVAGDVRAMPLRGIAMLGEWIVHHAPSRSIVAADIVANLHGDVAAPTRLAFTAAGVYGRFAVPREIRWLLVRDRAALRRSIDAVLALDFDRVVVGHGDNVETGGKAAFGAAFGWLKPTERAR